MLTRELVFLQGDDASAVFALLYPNGGVKTIRDPKVIINYLLQYTSDDVEREVTELDDRWSSGKIVTKDHVLLWNYAYCEIALLLRVTKKSLKVKVAA